PSIVTVVAIAYEPADEEDRAGGRREGGRQPAGGQVEDVGRRKQKERPECRDRRTRRERDGVRSHGVAQLLASAARRGAVSSWNSPGPYPGLSTEALSLLITRSWPMSTLPSISTRGVAEEPSPTVWSTSIPLSRSPAISLSPIPTWVLPWTHTRPGTNTFAWPDPSLTFTWTTFDFAQSRSRRSTTRRPMPSL